MRALFVVAVVVDDVVFVFATVDEFWSENTPGKNELRFRTVVVVVDDDDEDDDKTEEEATAEAAVQRLKRTDDRAARDEINIIVKTVLLFVYQYLARGVGGTVLVVTW